MRRQPPPLRKRSRENGEMNARGSSLSDSAMARRSDQNLTVAHAQRAEERAGARQRTAGRQSQLQRTARPVHLTSGETVCGHLSKALAAISRSLLIIGGTDAARAPHRSSAHTSRVGVPKLCTQVRGHRRTSVDTDGADTQVQPAERTSRDVYG